VFPQFMKSLGFISWNVKMIVERVLSRHEYLGQTYLSDLGVPGFTVTGEMVLHCRLVDFGRLIVVLVPELPVDFYRLEVGPMTDVRGDRFVHRLAWQDSVAYLTD
jgi:hypothetical protein